ncbi:MAG TPA: aldo/keto reductase [Deinococcales bacterium]|nr:aldo/keto reductase [Deinococcales bacterium]
METRDFGRTGLKVSVLGFGAGQVGAEHHDDDAMGRLLNEVLDLGINLVDTARGYGLSEERIGRHLAHRRDDYVLSTKGGYGVEGVPDWTPESITRGVERALRTLRTDRLDIFHLHSCPLDVLQRDDILDAVRGVRDGGLVRAAAYSGENQELAWAAASGVFDSLQTSVNPFDQWSLRNVLPTASERGLGIIAKRPIANAIWKHQERPEGRYGVTYWDRQQQMRLDPGLDWAEYALRFSAFTSGVHSIIVGTANIEHLRSNAAQVAKGPLPGEIYQRALEAFNPDWPGEV